MFFYRKKEKSLFFGYAMSYISLVFLSIVIIMVILLNYYAKDMMESYREMEEYKTFQMEEELNHHLEITNQLNHKIRTSVMFHPFYFEKSESKKMDVLEQFALYKGSSLFLNDYFLFYPNREEGFSSNGVLYKFHDLLKTVWVLEDANTVLKRLKELETFSVLQVENNMLWFCFSTRFYTSNSDSYAVLICRISKNELLDYVKNRVNIEKNQVAVFYSGELLVASVENDVDWEGERKEGFEVYSNFSAGDYVAKFSLLQKTNILFVFAVLSVLLISGLRVAYSHVRQIRNICDRISSQLNLNTKFQGNELVYIENLFDHTHKLNRNYMQQLQQQMNLLKKHIILTIINGKWKPEMLDQLELLHMNLNGKYLAVIRVGIPGLGRSEMETIVGNVEKLSDNSIQYYAVYEENNDEIVVLVAQEQEDLWIESVELIRELLMVEWKEAQVYIGPVYGEINHVVHSYLEAAKYPSINQDLESVQTESMYHNDCVHKIEIAIMAGNYEEAYLLFKRMIQEMKKINSMLLLQCMYSDVLSMLMRVAAKMEIIITQQQIGSLLTANQIDAFSEKTEEVIRILCEKIGLTHKVDANDTMYAVKKYVDEHFLDYDLAIETVAEEFHISATYISRAFKRVAGKNYKDYITQLKVEYAKKLLCEGRTVLDVSGILGYTSPSHFIKVFKKQTGITPRIYQENDGTVVQKKGGL